MATNRKQHAKWEDAEVTTMIEILMDASDGNTCDNGFKPSTWQQVADALTDDLKTRDSCASKFIRLKKDYKEVKYLHDLSGFGWDHERDVVVAEEDVWAPILQGRPELRKWKRNAFPWFEQIEIMYGDRLAIGNHSFRPDQQSPIRQSSDNEDDLVIIDTITHTPAQDRSAQRTPQLQDAEVLASAKRQSTPADLQQQKRRKTTGIAVMEDMTHGVKSLAEAMRENTAVMSQPVREEVQSSLEGQAQLQVQNESCLTRLGKLVMLNMLANSSLARTYLAISSVEMRNDWIKMQLQEYEETHNGVIYDWYIELGDYSF